MLIEKTEECPRCGAGIPKWNYDGQMCACDTPSDPGAIREAALIFTKWMDRLGPPRARELSPAAAAERAEWAKDRSKIAALLSCRACEGSGFTGSGDRTKECGDCAGTGLPTLPVPVDAGWQPDAAELANEMWEALFGETRDNVPEGLTDELLTKLAGLLLSGFTITARGAK